MKWKCKLAILLTMSLILASPHYYYCLADETTVDEFTDDSFTTETYGENFDIIEWDNLQFKALCKESSYSKISDKFFYYPYLYEDKSVSVRKIMISNRNMWNTVLISLSGNGIYKTDRYSYVTLEDGTTVGYLPCDQTYAYIFETNTLPSIYLRAVMERCRRNT